MKRSAKVALTLLVPAMTAFGCGQQSVNNQVPQSVQSGTISMSCSRGHPFSVSRDLVGTVVRCPACEQQVTVPATSNRSTGYNSNSPYRRSWGFYPWFGGYGSRYDSYPPSQVPTTVHTPSETRFPNSPSPISNSNHLSSNSSISRGGFGGTGAHFSGGS